MLRELTTEAPAPPPAGARRARPQLLRAGGGDIALTLTRVISIVLTALSSAVVARALGPHGYGVFAAGTGVATLMVLGKTFGADALYLRGAIDERTLQRRSFYAGLINLGVVAVAGLAWPGLSWTARGCEFLMGAASAVGYARMPWLVIPAKRMQFATRARRELLGNALSLGGVVLLAVGYGRPLLAAAGLLAGNLIFLFVSLPSLRNELTSTGQLRGDGSVKSGLTFTAIDSLFVAYFALDGAMIAAMRPAVDAGLYRVAYSFVIAAAVVPVALNGDVLRVRLWRLDGEARSRALRRAIKLTAAAALAVTLCFELLGGVGERLFFGTRFAAAIPVIRLLGLAMPFHYANSLMSNWLVGAGRMRVVRKVQTAMLAINVVGNLFLISAYGPKGAAIMTAATEAAGLALYATVAARRSTSSVALAHSSQE